MEVRKGEGVGGICNTVNNKYKNKNMRLTTSCWLGWHGQVSFLHTFAYHLGACIKSDFFFYLQFLGLTCLREE